LQTPADVAGYHGISCPASASCYAVGTGTTGAGVILATTNAGQLWTSQHLPAGSNDLDGISCPAVTTCAVTGGNVDEGVLQTTNGGKTWTRQPVPGKGFVAYAV